MLLSFRDRYLIRKLYYKHLIQFLLLPNLLFKIASSYSAIRFPDIFFRELTLYVNFLLKFIIFYFIFVFQTIKSNFMAKQIQKENIIDLMSKKSILYKDPSGLKRILSVRDLTFFGIAAIIGAGIFSTIGRTSYDGGPQ